MNRPRAVFAAVGLGLALCALAACGPAADPAPIVTTKPAATPPPAVATQAPTPAASTAPPAAATAQLDPRFSTCAEAIKAGYGDYQKGVDPEFDWYRDADGDGIVCEK